MPERRAAVPNYVGNDFRDTPPGHRFALYLKSWDSRFALVKDQKRDALHEVVGVGQYSVSLIRAVRERQVQIAKALGPSVLHLRAESTSPFITGTGIDHPLEIGFAFLNPYGVPYVPGSGIKGVLRRAAEELALGIWGERRGWDVPSIWWLFGFEVGSAYLTGPASKMRIDVAREEADQRRARWQSALQGGAFDKEVAEAFVRRVIGLRIQGGDSGDPVAVLKNLVGSDGDGATAPQRLREQIHYRGALAFWDSLIEPAGETLGLDILNPHFGDYYQGVSTPADCGKPVPSFFVIVPPGSRFDFFVQVTQSRLPERLAQGWRTLVQVAFELAFEWLGFGAKGAVGYGRMVRQGEVPVAPEDARARASDFASRLAQIRALPGGGRSAGQVAPFVEWCLGLDDAEQRRQAAREIVSRMGESWVRRKAKEDERWRKVLELAR
jgi:CRISPR-associated protein Cmr6